MAEELQGLLNKIQTDGLKKSEEERERILADARRSADETVAAAKAEAEKIIRKAKTDAESTEAKAESAIQQAARDVLISLKAELLRRMNNLVKGCAGQAMTPEVMAGVIQEMSKAFAANPNAEKVEAVLPVKTLDALEEKLKAAMGEDLRKNTTVLPGRDFSAGLKIGFSGSDLFLDFSDDALADMICDYVGPKLAAILKA